MEPQDQFAALAGEFTGCPSVTLPAEPGRGSFGSSALKVNGAIFAMLTRGHLVVKLPHQRVDALTKDGTGVPFDAGKGRPIKEWLAVTNADHATWLILAREAHDFVKSRFR